MPNWHALGGSGCAGVCLPALNTAVVHPLASEMEHAHTAAQPEAVSACHSSAGRAGSLGRNSLLHS